MAQAAVQRGGVRKGTGAKQAFHGPVRPALRPIGGAIGRHRHSTNPRLPGPTPQAATAMARAAPAARSAALVLLALVALSPAQACYFARSNGAKALSGGAAGDGGGVGRFVRPHADMRRLDRQIGRAHV